jgi:type IV secretory pathway TrbD component
VGTKFLSWVLHPDAPSGDRKKLASEVALRVLAVVSFCTAVIVVGIVVVPLVVRLLIIAALLAVGLLFIAVSLMLFGARPDSRSRPRGRRR